MIIHCTSLENGRASFDFAQDEAHSLMPLTILPHPELVEGRRMPMQWKHAITLE
jgi:hypothetical protein